MVPDLRQMRYVVEVAREKSFSRAASNLHVAQQAVSQQVKAIEETLGVQLFTRTRGVEVTVAGEAFVQEARRTLNAADRVGKRAQAAARGEVGTLRLAYTLATVYETLPAVVDAVAAAEHPDLKVRPREVFAEDIERLRPRLAGRPDHTSHPPARRGRRPARPGAGLAARLVTVTSNGGRRARPAARTPPRCRRSRPAT